MIGINNLMMNLGSNFYLEMDLSNPRIGRMFWWLNLERRSISSKFCRSSSRFLATITLRAYCSLDKKCLTLMT